MSFVEEEFGDHYRQFLKGRSDAELWTFARWFWEIYWTTPLATKGINKEIQKHINQNTDESGKYNGG